MSDVNMRSRGRPRLFDEEAVLDELTALFWRKGYSQTSMTDLVDASGVHKSSLYSTFGSKEELFSKILRRYLDSRMDMLSALIEQAGPGIDGIHAFLEILRSNLASGTGQRGCLLANTSSELCGTAPGFEDFGVEHRRALRERLRGLIVQAERDGTASENTTGQRTDLFMTFMLGLNLTVRGGADENEIGRAIDAM
ncbi:MAG: TetR/AcrR family transcriptional regulator, partial [Myxococcales bacterium]|nr:TetR/AcrR family transcriptional regulator [Myxococcales bacterium]